MRTNNNKGFTIIELLIVIVIIGILVAITAVSYTGITNGANTAEMQTKARDTIQFAVGCQAKTGAWPTISGTTIACSQSTGLELPKQSNGNAIIMSASAPDSGSQKTTLQYVASGNTVTVTYWDSTKTPAATSSLTN